MMKRTIVVLIILSIILPILLILVVRFTSGDEDNWICANGKWVKHGNPTSQMPDTPCEPNEPNNPGNSELPDPEIPQDRGENIVCTQEAKLCPDGSYVGRIPPRCEFSPCP